ALYASCESRRCLEFYSVLHCAGTYRRFAGRHAHPAVGLCSDGMLRPAGQFVALAYASTAAARSSHGLVDHLIAWACSARCVDDLADCPVAAWLRIAVTAAKQDVRRLQGLG